jgi:hypothetical protein
MALCTEEMWAARDMDGELGIFKNKPFFILSDIKGGAWKGAYREEGVHIKTDLFSKITFENSPKKVKITFEL